MLNLTPNLKLKEAQAKIEQQITAKQQKAAQAGVELARALCPVGSVPHKDGSPHMRDTIGYLILPNGAVVLFCQAPYSEFVEFGTYKMSARPFMTPAREFMFVQLMNELRSLLG